MRSVLLNNAAQAASFHYLMPLRVASKTWESISSVISASLRLPAPLSPVEIIPSNRYTTDDFRPGASGCVRVKQVHPDGYSLYLSSSYTIRPSRPGENQHTRTHARARGKSLLSFVIYFILKVKTPGRLGHLFNIINLRSDIHPDAPGRLGRIINGGFFVCH